MQGEGVSAFKAEECRKEKTRRIFMFGANQNGFVVPVCLCQVAGLLLQLPEIDGFRGAQVKDGVILPLKSIVLVFIEIISIFLSFPAALCEERRGFSADMRKI